MIIDRHDSCNVPATYISVDDKSALAKVETMHGDVSFSWSTEMDAVDVFHLIKGMVGNLATEYQTQLVFESDVYEQGTIDCLDQVVDLLEVNDQPKISVVDTAEGTFFWHPKFLYAPQSHELTVSGRTASIDFQLVEGLIDVTAVDDLRRNRPHIMSEAFRLLVENFQFSE